MCNAQFQGHKNRDIASICCMCPNRQYVLFSIYLSLFMKTFKDLAFVYEGLCGDKVWSRSYMIFDNGYGVSVIRGPHSYGGQKGLYELAVLGTDGFITYETPVTNDVIGFLKSKDVTKHMIEIQELPILNTQTK